MSDFTSRTDRFETQPVEPLTVISADSDGDGASDVEELLAGTDPKNAASTPGPVVEATLPPLGSSPATTQPVTDTITAQPVVAVAATTPTGVAIGSTLDAAALGGITLDASPSHLGVDFSVAGLNPSGSVADALGVVSPTGASATVAPRTGAGYSTLGPLPGFGLVAADGDGETTTANPDGSTTTTVVVTTSNEKGVTVTTQETTEDGASKSVTTTVTTTESDGDVVTITTTDTYEKDDGTGGINRDVEDGWRHTSGKITASGTNDGQQFDWWRQTYPPGNTYDSGEGGDALPAALSPIVEQIIATGLDPTTTTTSGHYVDDGGAGAITADAVAGATTVLGVAVRPGVTDGTGETEIAVVGDVGTRLGATGPDVVGPSDPVLGGAEPISAGDLTPRPGAGNPIAGGEDEDLEDLEIQRLTPGGQPGPAATAVDETVSVSEASLASYRPSPWTPGGEAGSGGAIYQVAEPVAVATAGDEPVPFAGTAPIDPMAITTGDLATVGDAAPGVAPVSIDPPVGVVPDEVAVVGSLSDSPTLAALLPDGVLETNLDGSGLIEPDVPIATALPDGTVIGATLDGVVVGNIAIDTRPSHYGVDLSTGGVTEVALVDQGATPITTEAVAGAAPVGGLNVPVNPGIIDGGFEVDVVGTGAIGAGLDAKGPDVIDPNDPTLGGSEPISAGGLNAPGATNSNPTASTTSAMRVADASTDSADTVSPWTPAGEAGTAGSVYQEAAPMDPAPAATMPDKVVAPDLSATAGPSPEMDVIQLPPDDTGSGSTAPSLVAPAPIDDLTSVPITRGGRGAQDLGGPAHGGRPDSGGAPAPEPVVVPQPVPIMPVDPSPRVDVDVDGRIADLDGDGIDDSFAAPPPALTPLPSPTPVATPASPHSGPLDKASKGRFDAGGAKGAKHDDFAVKPAAPTVEQQPVMPPTAMDDGAGLPGVDLDGDGEFVDLDGDGLDG